MDEEVPPQIEQVDQGAQCAQGVQVTIRGEGNEIPVVPSNMNNGEIREALLDLAQAMTTHVNRDIEARMIVVETTMRSS